MKIFENVTWPTAMVYNVQAKSGFTYGGGADIEHVNTEDEKWTQEKKVKLTPCSEVEVIKAKN